MIGPFLIVIGLLLVWVAVRGKSEPLIKALGLDTVPTNINKNITTAFTQWIWDPLTQAISGINPLTGVTHGVNQPGTTNKAEFAGSVDSGSHMGIDASGNLVTINKTYGAMSDAERDAANRFAHQHPSGM